MLQKKYIYPISLPPPFPHLNFRQFQKNPSREDEDILLWKNSGIFRFRFLTLSLEIPEKTNFRSWIFRKIVLPTPLGNSNSNNQDPWKFHVTFSWSPPRISAYFFSIPLEIPGRQPPSPPPPHVWIFLE